MFDSPHLLGRRCLEAKTVGVEGSASMLACISAHMSDNLPVLMIFRPIHPFAYGWSDYQVKILTEP
jgi:hypothetical protein